LSRVCPFNRLPAALKASSTNMVKRACVLFRVILLSLFEVAETTKPAIFQYYSFF
jgi:hypothetical protein